MSDELTPEDIEKNFNKFRALCEKAGGDRAQKLLSLIDHLGERLALCPASAKLDHHDAFPGGLIYHSLQVLYNAKVIVNAFEWDVPKDSLVICALMHDIGKCAHVEEDGTCVDYYVPQDSTWYRDNRGEIYKYNKEIPYLTTAHRSIWLLNQYEVKLTHDEYVAIMIHDGWVLEENKKYMFKEPTIAMVMQMAGYIAAKSSKENA